MSSEGESIEIILERGNKAKPFFPGLGFNIKGGIDASHLEEDTGIFITKIRDTGAASEDERLKEGDKILEINDQSLVEVKHAQAVNYFRNSGNTVKLKVVQGEEQRILDKRIASMKDPTDKFSGSNFCLLAGVGIGVLVISVFIAYKLSSRKA